MSLSNVMSTDLLYVRNMLKISDDMAWQFFVSAVNERYAAETYTATSVPQGVKRVCPFASDPSKRRRCP